MGVGSKIAVTFVAVYSRAQSGTMSLEYIDEYIIRDVEGCEKRRERPTEFQQSHDLRAGRNESSSRHWADFGSCYTGPVAAE